MSRGRSLCMNHGCRRTRNRTSIGSVGLLSFASSSSSSFSPVSFSFSPSPHVYPSVIEKHPSYYVFIMIGCSEPRQRLRLIVADHVARYDKMTFDNASMAAELHALKLQIAMGPKPAAADSYELEMQVKTDISQSKTDISQSKTDLAAGDE